MTTGERLTVTDLNQTLTGVENELLKRMVDRQDATIDAALDVINRAAENGDIDIVDSEDSDDIGDIDDETSDSDDQEDSVVDGDG